MCLQVNLFQKHLFLHQLTHNMKRVFIDIPLQYIKTTSSEHIVYITCLFFVMVLTFKKKCSDLVVFIKEVCNRGVVCSLLKLGSLEKTFIASLFHSGLHSGTIFCGKNDDISHIREQQDISFF